MALEKFQEIVQRIDALPEYQDPVGKEQVRTVQEIFQLLNHPFPVAEEKPELQTMSISLKEFRSILSRILRKGPGKSAYKHGSLQWAVATVFDAPKEQLLEDHVALDRAVQTLIDSNIAGQIAAGRKLKVENIANLLLGIGKNHPERHIPKGNVERMFTAFGYPNLASQADARNLLIMLLAGYNRQKDAEEGRASEE